jgi:hypothetical protein
MKPHSAILAQMLMKGCQDTSHSVSSEAMSATVFFIEAFADDPEVMKFQIVLDPMMKVMELCLSRGDESIVAEGLEVIMECVEMEQPLINDYVQVW